MNFKHPAQQAKLSIIKSERRLNELLEIKRGKNRSMHWKCIEIRYFSGNINKNFRCTMNRKHDQNVALVLCVGAIKISI